MNFYSNIAKIQQEVHTAKVFCGSVNGTADVNRPRYSRVSFSGVLIYVVEGHPLFAIPCVGIHVISCCTGELSSLFSLGPSHTNAPNPFGIQG